MAGLFAFAVPSDVDASQFKRIRDVNVSCSNALRCDLYIVNAGVSLYNFGIRRSAASGAPVSFFLTMRQALVAGSDVVVAVDGVEVFSVPAAELRYRAAIGEYTLLDEERIETFLAAAAAGRDLRVTYRTNRGQTTAQYSLSGFIAGVIFMDEAQNRVGRDDALQARLAPARTGGGSAGTSGGEGDVVFGEVETIPDSLRGLYGGETAPCGQLERDRAELIGGFELRASPGYALVALPCGEGGAYNQPFSVWVNTGDTYFPTSFPIMTDNGPSVEPYAYNLGWDAEAQRLVSFFKGRGIGDCG
ncbi:MAG: DUF1176 domain-containing protein, partial [Pseudomonadota bacterium]